MTLKKKTTEFLFASQAGVLPPFHHIQYHTLISVSLDEMLHESM